MPFLTGLDLWDLPQDRKIKYNLGENINVHHHLRALGHHRRFCSRILEEGKNNYFTTALELQAAQSAKCYRDEHR